MVEDSADRCAICGRIDANADWAAAGMSYPGRVCEACDEEAVNARGVRAATDSISDTGENPVYIRGRRCFRRYRFGGWITMRDAVGAGDVVEFQDRHITGHWARDLLREAQEVLALRGEPILDAFPIGDRMSPRESAYRGAAFDWGGKPWVVCRTALISGNARLVEAATAYRLGRGAVGAVAILDPPVGHSVDEPSSSDDYFARYRDIAWHGLGVVWVPADRLRQPWRVEPTPPPSHCDWLNDLCTRLRPLLTEGVRGFHSASSRDAEKIVHPIVDRVLTTAEGGLGFARSSHGYRGFWRGPRADGAWERRGAAAPRRLALEVKVTEDIEAPFCQVMENLGTSDAVLYVRVVNDASREREQEMQRSNPLAMRLRDDFERLAPARYLDIPSG